MVKPRFKFDAFSDFAKERQIAQAEMKRYASSGSVVTWEPTIVGTTTSPANYQLGDSGVDSTQAIRGYMIRHDDHINLWFDVGFSSSFTAGTGIWLLTMPAGIALPATTTAMGRRQHMGTWTAFDASTSSLASGSIHVYDASHVWFLYSSVPPSGPAAAVAATQPYPWGLDDTFSGHMVFPLL